MRYPVGDGTQEAFTRDWYVAQGFGTPVSYGFHEAADINLRTGGDTDLGEPVRAIANGQLVYWHYDSHFTTGFGRHLVYKIPGLWGERYVHCAHLQEADFLKVPGPVTEGQIVGRIGKSGNSPLAHLHFAIFKVDPGGAIDNVANTQAELNLVWEDPIAFIRTWMPDCVIRDNTHIPQIENKTVLEIKLEISALRDKLAKVRAIVA